MPVKGNVQLFWDTIDPLALFPFRVGYHYTEEGQRLVAEEILRALAHTDVHSMFKGS